MPFSLPALADLRTQFRANFAARLAGFASSLRISVAGIMADGMAGGIFAGFRALGWLSRQLFIDSVEAPYLDRRLGNYAFTRIPGSGAAGNMVFSGSANIPIPVDTPMIPAGSLTDSNGAALQFITTAAGNTGSTGTVSLPVVASGPGAVTNFAAGTPMTLVDAISGVLPQVTVDVAGLTGGSDRETDAAFRARGLARIRQPPQGGAAWDYVTWAKAVAGVTRAWCLPLGRGPGTVDVFFVMDGRPSNIPLTADIANVQAAITAARPVTADAKASAPMADALLITITGMLPVSAQAAVTAQLTALAASIAPGGVTAGDGVSSTTPPGLITLTQISAAIQAGGAVFYALTAPTGSVSFATGHIPAPPTVTYL